MEVKSNSKEETQKIARDLSKTLKVGDVITLSGDLGAGKTVFVQGLARGLGIEKRILSPTFVFVRSYPTTIEGKTLDFHHIDLYRSTEKFDFASLGMEELLSNDSIIAIEWAEKLGNLLPKERIEVFLEKENENSRKIKIRRIK